MLHGPESCAVVSLSICLGGGSRVGGGAGNGENCLELLEPRNRADF